MLLDFLNLRNIQLNLGQLCSRGVCFCCSFFCMVPVVFFFKGPCSVEENISENGGWPFAFYYSGSCLSFWEKEPHFTHVKAVRVGVVKKIRWFQTQIPPFVARQAVLKTGVDLILPVPGPSRMLFPSAVCHVKSLVCRRDMLNLSPLFPWGFPLAYVRRTFHWQSTTAGWQEKALISSFADRHPSSFLSSKTCSKCAQTKEIVWLVLTCLCCRRLLLFPRIWVHRISTTAARI